MPVGCTKALAAAFNVFDIGYPVAPPSREASLDSFTIEACRRTAKQRLINSFERVDANNRIKVIVNSAGDNGYDAAPGTDVELCRPGAESVFRYERAIFDHDLQSPPWIGRPHATVLGAERAAACASRNFSGIRLPDQGKGDVSAVAFAIDQHACDVRRRGSQRPRSAAAPCSAASSGRTALRLSTSDRNSDPVALEYIE